MVTTRQRHIGFFWGIGGVLSLLLFAVYRLLPVALELRFIPLGAVQSAALAFSVVYMIYAEGYRGFHRGFAPRVVLRADYLRRHPRTIHTALAPLFCMGYIHATRRRRLFSYGLTAMIVCFVLIARQLPQPWRGIVDAGVVAGLIVGIASIFYFLLMLYRDPAAVPGSPDVPDDFKAQETN